MAAKTSKSKNSSPGSKARRTVASVSAEVVELRAEVVKLRAEIVELRAEMGEPRAEMVELRAEVRALQERVVRPEIGDEGAVAAGPATAVVATVAATDPVEPMDPMDEVHAVLREVFRLALTPMPDDPDEQEELFERFADLVHSDRRGSALLDQSLRSYTWGQLRHNVGIYLRDEGDVGSYVITRSTPRALDDSSSRVKLYLKAKTRMPTPIGLRRDDRARGRWRIESCSL